MIDSEFVWDAEKYEINFKKHGVLFEEAATVFEDDNALLKYDPDHSQDEDRFIILGYSKYARLLLVCHCYRNDDAIIRIISARKANKDESKEYGGSKQ
ncbi:MAG: BrnT family toxin [Defluviitaleaceae bacterium]|nr:BrnT family toxin [Defluviitaleaceae bacterium]